MLLDGLCSSVASRQRCSFRLVLATHTLTVTLPVYFLTMLKHLQISLRGNRSVSIVPGATSLLSSGSPLSQYFRPYSTRFSAYALQNKQNSKSPRPAKVHTSVLEFPLLVQPVSLKLSLVVLTELSADAKRENMCVCVCVCVRARIM